VFMLFGANEMNSFVSWIYSASQPFVAPFNGIFSSTTLFGGRVEMQSVVALVVYTLAASLLNMVFSGRRTAHPV
jgi:type IV secretory pathway VirB2 component (pilin)